MERQNAEKMERMKKSANEAAKRAEDEAQQASTRIRSVQKAAQEAAQNERDRRALTRSQFLNVLSNFGGDPNAGFSYNT